MASARKLLGQVAAIHPGFMPARLGSRSSIGEDDGNDDELGHDQRKLVSRDQQASQASSTAMAARPKFATKPERNTCAK